MSAEKIINREQKTSTSNTPQVDGSSSSGIVDINDLLARVRSEKQEENKINLIFFGLFAALIIIAGILLSL